MSNPTTIEMAVSALKPGMYVSELDRPWLETPYLIQGISIQSQEDIDRLKIYCKYVYVDIDKSESFVAQLRIPASLKLQKNGGIESLDPLLRRVTIYIDICSAKEEIAAAAQAYEITTALFSDINSNIERNTKFDIRVAHEVVDTLCESIVRNPDAAILLAQLKTTGRELYDNAIKASIHLLAFGRHLGLPRKELSILGLGGLLMDVGKLRLPKEIQAKKSLFLNPNERKLVKQHIAYGEEIVTQLSDASDEVIKIVLQHHERENGSGYPRGLHANQLHPYGRMAAIVDCYEELIWGQPDNPGMKPCYALKELQENAQNGLNYALVDQFAHSIGTFPIGSLVELNTGEIAIVLMHNRTQRFLPTVMIICDAQKKPYGTPLTVDLKTTHLNQGGIQYSIVNDLPQGAYGIDASKYYL
jgi:HD-GYP domain-containing protein (c-di-GMP phosphodiesterase class II)